MSKTVPFHRALVWNDEFSGAANALPDWHKWRPWVNCNMGSELECYTNETTNVSTDGAGILVITARVETYSYGGHTKDYTSAKLDTNNNITAQYGSVKARIKIPSGKGLWPAFWMIGGDIDEVGNTACGEIDIMEVLGDDPTMLHLHIHGATDVGAAWSKAATYDSPVSLADDFHIYGLDWQPNSISITLDGVVRAAWTPADLSAGQVWPFNKPFNVLLNLAVGGTWPGSPDETTVFPASMYVDWVRVYA